MVTVAVGTITTTTTTTDTIIMADASLYRLMAWLSPSYPVGAFAYSHGIEWAIEDGQVTDEATLTNWISDVLQFGGGWSDAVLFAHAHRCADNINALSELNAYAIALSPSKERHLETTSQGTAFLKTSIDAWTWAGAGEVSVGLGPDVAYSIAVAAVAAGHGIACAQALHAYLHGVAANLVSAGVRLVPLGQTAGQRAIASLEDAVNHTAAQAIDAEISSVGGSAILSDIAAMKHETQYTRLFRS